MIGAKSAFELQEKSGKRLKFENRKAAEVEPRFGNRLGKSEKAETLAHSFADFFLLELDKSAES